MAQVVDRIRPSTYVQAMREHTHDVVLTREPVVWGRVAPEIVLAIAWRHLIRNLRDAHPREQPLRPHKQ